jgi:hypothetical protein
MNRSRNHTKPSGAMVVALLALLLAMSGSAVAASLITSKQIKDGTIQTKDISKKARRALAAKASTVPGPQGPKGDTGAAGANGANGADGAAGAPGSAKAFAFVNPTCPGGECGVTKSKNVGKVTRVFTGVYCIAVPGVDRSSTTYGAGVDYRTTANQGLASVQTDATSLGCDQNGHPGEYEVTTSKITGAATAAAASDVGFWVAFY